MSKPVVAVAFYSTWGHVATLAEEVIKGVESTGAIAKPYVFQETLTEEILSKMHAGSSLKPRYPVLTPNDLREVDGLIIGAPTRYGRVPAQVSTFFDACGQLWATGALVGKFVTLFTSVAGQHGGHETTALTTMPFFVHQGMVYVPIGYSTPILNELDQVAGGSPYGASTISAGDGSKQPLPQDLEVARHQGKFFADFVGTFVRGKHLLSQSAHTTSTTSGIAAKELPTSETEAIKTEGYTVASIDELGLGAPITTGTTTAAPGATRSTEAESVPAPVQAAPAPAPAANTNSTTTAPAPAAAVEPAPASAPAAAVEPKVASAPAPASAPVTEKKTTAAAAPAATAAPKKKKGGFFGCCGGDGIEN